MCCKASDKMDPEICKQETANYTDSLLESNRGYNKEYRHDKKPGCCSVRWVVAYMGMWMGFIAYLMNANMSISVVCMMQGRNNETINNGGHKVVHSRIKSDDHVTNSTNHFLTVEFLALNESLAYNVNSTQWKESDTRVVEFDWNKQTRSFILSAYFYGFMFIQIPAGWLAARFGGRIVIGLSMGVSCLTTLLLPVFARSSVVLVVAARICLGTCGGMGPPSFCGLIGAWALPTERNRFMAMFWFGQLAGAVIGYSSSGVLCEHGFDGGWPSIFYVHGSLGVVFVVFWWMLVYDSPQTHPRISEAELSTLLPDTVHKPKIRSSKKDVVIVPWRKIFTYGPIYALFVASTCDAWTFYLLLTCLPQYLKEVLHFDIQSNGLYSCLPSITYMFGLALAGILADYVRSKKIVSSTASRKIFQIIGFIGVAVFILIPGYLTEENRHIVILCLCFCTLFEAVGALGGYTSNPIDIAPRFSPVIFGISNTLASIPGIIAPLIVAKITKNQTSEEWRTVFYIAAGVSVFASIVYGIFGNSEQAPWSQQHQTNQDITVEITHTTKLAAS